MNALGRRLARLEPWVLARQERRLMDARRRRERDPEARELMAQYHALLDRLADATPPETFTVDAWLAVYVVRGVGVDPEEIRAFIWQMRLADQSPEGRTINARLAAIDARLAQEDAR
jgi:hypothetical protein